MDTVPRPPWKMLSDGGICGASLGASGLFLKLTALSRGDPELVPHASAQLVLVLFLLTFIIGEAMGLYGLLLSKGAVPAVSTELAQRLFWIPVAPFLLALAVEAPLLGTTSAMLFCVRPVANERGMRPRAGRDAGMLGNDL